jgi:hypothetical protein
MATWTITEFIAMALGCLGVYFFAHGLLRLLRRNPEESWTKITGKIVVSEIDFSGDVYRAKILYTYTFNGQIHEGSRIAPLQAWSSFRSTAAYFVDKYRVGRDADVYVDPSDPGCSVLEPQKQPVAALAETLLGVAAAGFGYFGWLTSSL